jgi:RND family efflux transporter MFP subunit
MRTPFAIPVICGAVLCSCSAPNKTEVRADSDVPAVSVSRVTRQTLTRELIVSAEFRPYEEVDLHAKIAGYLKQISVDVGDHVAAGQVIATLEVPEMVNEMAQAEATARRSQAELARARGEFARAPSAHQVAHVSYQRLADVVKARPNLVAQQELDDALGKDRVAEAQVDSAQAAITVAEEQIGVSKAEIERLHTMEDYTKITVPFAGVISKRYADPGAMIPAGTASSSQAMPVVRVSEISRLRLVLPTPESVVPRIHVGEPIEIRVGAVHRTIQGRVSRFSDRLQTATRTMETEVDVENPKGELVPGMYAEAVITTDRKDNVLTVPVQIGGGSGTQTQTQTVMIVDGGRLAGRQVTFGLDSPDRREVLSGLKEGDLVVVSKNDSLKEGDPVSVRETADKGGH